MFGKKQEREPAWRVPNEKTILRHVNSIRVWQGVSPLPALPHGIRKRADGCVLFNALRDAIPGLIAIRGVDGFVLNPKASGYRKVTFPGLMKFELASFVRFYDKGYYPHLEVRGRYAQRLLLMQNAAMAGTIRAGRKTSAQINEDNAVQQLIHQFNLPSAEGEAETIKNIKKVEEMMDCVA